MANTEVTTNQEVVVEITDHLLKCLSEYVDAHPTSDVLDVFMALHNFHRIGVVSIARQIEHKIPRDKTYRMADMTWRKAMRELKRL